MGNSTKCTEERLIDERAKGAAEEREACAKIAERMTVDKHSAGHKIAARIRARGAPDERPRTWTEDEIRAAWYRAQETGRASWERAPEPDDLANSWEHVRAALHGEEA